MSQGLFPNGDCPEKLAAFVPVDGTVPDGTVPPST